MMCEDCIFHDFEYWENTTTYANSSCVVEIDGIDINEFILNECGFEPDDLRELLKDECPLEIKRDFSIYEGYEGKF